MPTASVNGIALHYREAGEGFPIVLIHGYTGNSRNWALTIPALAGRFHTISVDLRGHGHSAKPLLQEDYTVEAMAADVDALIRHLGVSECFLAGHSMGGMIAQYLILSRPEPFRALVLVDTAAERPSGMRMEERARLVEIARTRGLEAVFEEQLKVNPLADQFRARPDLLEKYRQQFLMTSPEAYIHCAAVMAARSPLLEELPRIKAPTLIICGQNDEPFVQPSHNMHERITGSELAILPGAGHTPQIETPAQFNSVLTGFLSKVHGAVAAGG